MNKYNVARQSVLEAGCLIKNMMKEDIQVDIKSSTSDFVTNVDKQVEKFLVDSINNSFPDQNYLTEEKTRDFMGLENLWIIDPIDGTTNFVYKKKDFCISLAYYEKGMPVFGIVYDVMNDELFEAKTGNGAFLNGQKLDFLDQNRLLSKSVISGDVYRPNFFRATPSEIKSQIIAHRFLGSGALEICHVAANMSQAYVFNSLKAWDCAAAVIVLTEVGGTFLMGTQVNQLVFDQQGHLFIGAANSQIMKGIETWL